MPVQMTREEYLMKYGVSPSIEPASRVDTSVALPKMTRAEYEAKYSVSASPISSSRPDLLAGTKDAVTGLKTLYGSSKQSVGGKLIDDVIQGAKDIQKGLESKSTNPIAILNQESKGILKSGLRAAGDVAGAVYASIGAALQATGANKVIDKFGQWYVNTFAKDLTNDPIFQKFVKEHPSAEEDFGRASNLVLGALEKGTIEPKTAISRTVEQVSTIPEKISTAKNTLQTKIQNVDLKNQEAKQSAQNKEIIAKREQEIFNIENNYAKTRKANQYSKDAGSASRKRIAETDVLVNSVNTDGLIRTKQPGGAVDQYKAMTLDNAEGVVRKNLEREGSKVNLSKVEKQLTESVYASGLEGADLRTALNGVKKEVAGLRLKADVFGDIPLTLVHDAKINTTKNINYQTPPETATYRKSVASAYKKLVENNSGTNVEEVNPELSKYLEDVKLLERLDGARVKGGRLGKYFAQISGNIVGGLAGNLVGGPVGSAIVTVLGGEVAGRIKGNALSKTLGKGTGNTVPENPIIKKAVETGNSPRLALPAPKEGAPRVQLESGRTINLPKKTQSSVDEAQSKSLGSRNQQYTATNTTTRITIPSKVPSTVEIVKTFKNAKVKPPCVTNFLKIREQYPNAEPIRGIYATSLEESVKTYQRNIKSGTQQILDGFTHVKADIGAKILENNPNIPKGAKFFTEEQILRTIK